MLQLTRNLGLSVQYRAGDKVRHFVEASQTVGRCLLWDASCLDNTCAIWGLFGTAM